jgi:hypothetical protein
MMLLNPFAFPFVLTSYLMIAVFSAMEDCFSASEGWS